MQHACFDGDTQMVYLQLHTLSIACPVLCGTVACLLLQSLDGDSLLLGLVIVTAG